jgi:hypothetical protein
MNTTKSNLISFVFSAFNLITALLFPVFFVTSASAHNGEDHGGEKPKTVSNQTGTITRTVQVGEFEIMLKHAPLEPDAAASAKLFITRHGTNEAVGDAKATVEITAQNARNYDAVEVKSDAAGSFMLNLPPLPEGDYTILARITTAGETDTATFSAVQIQHTHVDSAEIDFYGTQKALMIFAAVVILGLFGGLIYFAAHVGKSDAAREKAVSV